MFTGIIKDIGEIVELDYQQGDLNLKIKTNLILENIDPLESGQTSADLNNDNILDILDIIILVTIIIN